MSEKFIFENGRLKKASLKEFCIFLECNERRLSVTNIGRFTVSTVFLSLDHSFSGKKPVLFETLVFDEKNLAEVNGHKFRREADKYDGRRYCTIAEAEAGHEEIVTTVRRDHPRSKFHQKEFQLGKFLPGGAAKAKMLSESWQATPLDDL